MCLVIFAWLVAQDYFKEMTDDDIRKRLYDEQKKQIEQIYPFGFTSDGLDDTESFVDGAGDRWNVDEYGDRSYMGVLLMETKKCHKSNKICHLFPTTNSVTNHSRLFYRQR